jgi:hypothetical protein
MMKLKYTFAAISVFIANMSFATVMPQFISSPGSYICGLPSSPHTTANWCDCFHNYLANSCKAMGGTDETCTDTAMRNIISEYGGPAVMCPAYHGQEMDEKTCEATLGHYLTQCPILPE